MKKIIILFVGAIAVVFACQKSTPPVTTNVDLKKGLLLYLPFDGNFADSSGNGNTVSGLNGAMLGADEHGYANQAYGGLGSTGPLVVTNNGSIAFDTAFSVSLNSMVFNNSPLQAYLAMTNWTTGYGPSFGVGLFIPNVNHVSFGVIDNTTNCNYFGKADSSNTTDTTSFVPSPGSWYNIVCTYGSKTLKTYVNGTLVSTKKAIGVAGVAQCPASQVIIGGWWSGGQELLNGRLDEIRMYNRVLNADEIAELSKDFKD